MPDSVLQRRWKAFRYQVEWVLCAGLTGFVPLLPRRLCVALANTLGSLGYRFDKRGRTVSLANLEMVFGNRYSPEERQTIARLSYQNFARTMLDLFWGSRLTQENWQNYIETGGYVDEFVKKREDPATPGSILMCVHWGNFEWASLAFGFLNCNTTIVAENFKNAQLTEFFSRARSTSGHTIIPQENSMLRLLKVVKRRGLSGMLIDLTLPPTQAAVAIDAFGRKMCVTFLHALLVQRGGAQMLPVHGEPLPNGRVRVVMDPPLIFPPHATPQEVVQLCWNHFEPRIRERPELWMWAYKHWRFRPRAAEASDYPFYANISPKFEKLLANPPASIEKKSKPATTG